MFAMSMNGQMFKRRRIVGWMDGWKFVQFKKKKKKYANHFIKSLRTEKKQRPLLLELMRPEKLKLEAAGNPVPISKTFFLFFLLLFFYGFLSIRTVWIHNENRKIMWYILIIEIIFHIGWLGLGYLVCSSLAAIKCIVMTYLWIFKIKLEKK